MQDNGPEYDVVVAGGGTGGVLAAIAAARNRANVLLIEKNGFLGGMTTGGLTPPWPYRLAKNAMEDFKDPYIGGIFAEIQYLIVYILFGLCHELLDSRRMYASILYEPFH